ncbi:MAG: hypothetical protein PF448_01885 [Bacteroidales bacterium]|jgi:hypothetical protein|nr:hypothetical protein [Bacteroidales bacterium]
MKRIILSLILTVVVSATYVFSQDNSERSTDRFILVDDLSTFFMEKENCIEINPFYIQNFDENESSKPVHLAVNAIKDVIKFGIASGSEAHYQQRRCYIRMEKSNYQESFYKALLAMDIKYVLLNEQKLTLPEFFELTINR